DSACATTTWPGPTCGQSRAAGGIVPAASRVETVAIALCGATAFLEGSSGRALRALRRGQQVESQQDDGERKRRKQEGHVRYLLGGWLAGRVVKDSVRGRSCKISCQASGGSHRQETSPAFATGTKRLKPAVATRPGLPS